MALEPRPHRFLESKLIRTVTAVDAWLDARREVATAHSTCRAFSPAGGDVGLVCLPPCIHDCHAYIIVSNRKKTCIQRLLPWLWVRRNEQRLVKAVAVACPLRAEVDIEEKRIHVQEHHVRSSLEQHRSHGLHFGPVWIKGQRAGFHPGHHVLGAAWTARACVIVVIAEEANRSVGERLVLCWGGMQAVCRPYLHEDEACRRPPRAHVALQASCACNALSQNGMHTHRSCTASTHTHHRRCVCGNENGSAKGGRVLGSSATSHPP